MKNNCYLCNMKIIMPIGISGSGKTRLYHKRYEGMTLVSPDEIRKEISGSISDQKCNNQVFKEVDAMVECLVRDNIDFYYDATNCNPTFRKEFVERFRGTDVKIIYMVLPCDMCAVLHLLRGHLPLAHAEVCVDQPAQDDGHVLSALHRGHLLPLLPGVVYKQDGRRKRVAVCWHAHVGRVHHTLLPAAHAAGCGKVA